MQRLFGQNAKCAEGISKLRQLIEVTSQAGIPPERLQIDLGIARGLDYYTGTVYETLLSDLPGIGSVCSGGRYDNLAGLYTKQSLPGVGASLGQPRDTKQMRAHAAVVPASCEKARIADPADVEHAAVLRIAATTVTTLRRDLSLPHPHTSHSTKGDGDR